MSWIKLSFFGRLNVCVCVHSQHLERNVSFMNQALYWHMHPALSSVQVNQAEMKFIWNSWDGCCQWLNRNPRPILQECEQGISTADAHGVFCGECLWHPASIGFLRKETCSLSSRSSSLLLLSTGFIPGRLSFLLAFVPRPTRPVKCEMTNE